MRVKRSVEVSKKFKHATKVEKQVKKEYTYGIEKRHSVHLAGTIHPGTIHPDSRYHYSSRESLSTSSRNIFPTRVTVHPEGRVTQLKHEQGFYQTETFLPSYNYSMTVLMHLIFAKRVRMIAGTKEEPPDAKPPIGRAQHHEGVAFCPAKAKPPDSKQPIGRAQNHEEVQFFQLKDEPPDAPHIYKPSPYRGKTLESQRRKKANLLSLGADCIISRSKSFQGGGYDEAIKSASTKEHGEDTNQKKNTFGENQPELTKDIYAIIEAYQLNQCGKVTVALFFPSLGFFPMGLPRKVFNEAILSHQGIPERWNWFKIFPHEEDIQFTSQQTSNEPDGDQWLLIGDFRPNHEELSYKPTCSTFLTHKGSFSSWNRTKINFGSGDMNFLNQRILPHIHLPYQDPILPYSDHHAFNSQRSRFPQPSLVLETLQDNQRLLRTRTFLPKLTRYKQRLHLPYLADLIIKSPTAIFSFHSAICFLF